MADKLTRADLLAAIEKADAEKHPAQQAYISDGGTDLTILDGMFDLDRIVSLLNERQGVGQSL